MSAATVAMGHQITLGVGKQSAFGTAVTRTLGIRAIEFGLALAQQKAQKDVLGHSSAHLNIAGKRGVEGNLKLYLPPNAALTTMLMEAGFGGLSTDAGTALDAAAGTKYIHSLSLADSLPVGGLSIEGDIDNGQSGEVFLWDSCKVNKFTLMQSLEDGLIMDMSMIGRDEVETSATGSLPYQTLRSFNWDDLVVTLAGSAIDVESFELSIENNLDGDSYKMGSRLRKNLNRKGTRRVTAKMDVELESDDIQDFFDALTENTLTAIWTEQSSFGAISSVAQYRKLTLSMPRVVINDGYKGAKDSGRQKISIPMIVCPTLNSDASELTATLVNEIA